MCLFRAACENRRALHPTSPSRFLQSEFLRLGKRKASWTICFLTKFLELVQEVDWLHGTLVSFPTSASWKDTQVLLADSPAKRFAALRPSFASQKQVLEHHDSSRLSFVGSHGIVPPDAKWIGLGQADDVSEMVVLANALWLSEVDAGAQFLLLESQSVWADVFVAWVTTEWYQDHTGRSAHQEGSGNVRVRQSLARASLDVREESAKIKHERENNACVGELRIQTRNLHEALLCGNWERVAGRSLMVLSPKTQRF